ncbi:hypothetical protein [Paractinoplanes lichenicola]|uniref:Uncharacterized protein n=1 Tax=Paractinoplanes lichenicola TaxID=2802976 RepID=A0ABS1W5D7_9ACTN|nr:hypothetical protein [Actinoplanes lichenicola]MBL7261944.1 hypothetical protein [Actinoplanes lichenicola]
MSQTLQNHSGSLALNGALYLALAGLCLVVAVDQVKRLVQPIGPLIRAAAAALAVFLCLTTALLLLAAALLSGR